jgi:hypothetical protein
LKVAKCGSKDQNVGGGEKTENENNWDEII